jgi:hypothetical protein
MANLIYLNRETTIWFVPAAAAQAEDEPFSVHNLAAGAGRQSDAYDFGVAAVPALYEWRAFVQFATAPVIPETVDIYPKTMGSSAPATAHPDNDDGVTDAAVSSINKLANLHYLGSIVVDEAVADIEMVASGTVYITARAIQVVFWNATADALTNDVDENGFMDRDLFLEYDFMRNTGRVLRDTTGRGNHAYCTDGTWVGSEVGLAYDWPNNQSEEGALTNVSQFDLDIAGFYTWEFYVKPYDFTIWQTLWGMRGADNDEYFFIYCHTNDARTKMVTFVWRTDAANRWTNRSANNVVDNDRFYHLCFTYDGNIAGQVDRTTLYVDGVPTDGGDDTDNGNALSFDNTTTVEIANNSIWDEGFMGEYALFRYYKRHLTQDEVRQRVEICRRRAQTFGGTHAPQLWALSLQTLAPSAIASLEAFGSPQLDLTVLADPVASAETFGSTTLIIEQFLSPDAIASLEAFGTAQIDLTVLATGIASLEAFGTAQLDLTVFPTSIASAETFGSATVVAQQFLGPDAIASAEAFGSPQLNLIVFPSSIASGETFGSPQLDLTVFPDGIATLEAFGSAQLNLTIFPSSIAGAEAFGTATLTKGTILLPDAIASLEAFGTLTIANVDQFIYPGSIPSGETFGTAILIGGVGGVPSLLLIEDPRVRRHIRWQQTRR